jgi:hypothetical protein
MIDRSACPARRHTRAAYEKAGCICPDAQAAYRRYRKQVHTNRIPPGRVPAIITVRQLRALHVLGHPTRELAPALRMSADMVRWILRCPSGHVHPRTAARVADVYARWRELPGTDRKTRLVAEKKQWAPPWAWDTESCRISDPSVPDEFAARTAGMHPTLRRTLLEEMRAEAAAAEARAQAWRESLAVNRARRHNREEPAA